MKIVFIGDSLTAGIPGVGYFSIIKNKIKDHVLINMGKGGDTVFSLFKRVKKAEFNDSIDLIILEVGTNDIFVNVSRLYPFIKTLLRQPWAKNAEEFKKTYKDLILFLKDKAKKIVVIPPIFLGEDLNSVWNRSLEELGKTTKEVVDEYNNISFLDIRKIYEEHFQNNKSSDYIADNAFRVVLDALLLRSKEAIDKKSESRGLYYTLDGAHFNSRGAVIYANAIIKEIYAYDSYQLGK